MSQQWGQGGVRVHLTFSAQMWLSPLSFTLTDPRYYHTGIIWKMLPSKKRLLLACILEVDRYQHDGVHVFTEGVVGWPVRGKRGGSVCSVNIYSDTCWMNADWLRWIVCVCVCVCDWVGDRTAVRQNYQCEWTSGVMLWWRDLSLQKHILFGVRVLASTQSFVPKKPQSAGKKAATIETGFCHSCFQLATR